MTRSCATCWSRKKTSASEAETTKVSCTWPSTRPKRGRASPAASPKSAGCSATAASPARPSSDSPPVPTSSPGTTAGRLSARCAADATIS